MTEYTETDRQAIYETRDNVLKLNIILLGTNGDKGIIGRVNRNNDRISQLEKWQAKTIGVAIGCILAGGFSGAGIVKLIGG